MPVESYQESIQECIEQKTGIPQWYTVLDDKEKIIVGVGIIDNDFRDWKDLGSMGFEKLYLVTDHTEFYEKCGWSFLTTVNDDEGNSIRMYAASTL